MLQRKAVMTILALMTACISSFYLDRAEFYWLVLSTFLVTQTPYSGHVRQVMQVMLMMIISVMMASFFQFNIYVFAAFASLTFVVTAYLYWLNRYSHLFARQLLLLIPFIVILTHLYLIHSIELVKYQCIAILVGGLEGLLFVRLFMQKDYAHAFKQEIIPVIDCLAECTEKLANDFVENHMFPIDSSASIIKKMIQSQCFHYPEWIYMPGFNPGLRSGMRFFLIHLERISEILYSLDSLVSSSIAKDKWQNLATLFSDALHRNKALLLTINIYLRNETPLSLDDSYTSDIADLDERLHQMLPKELALIDMDPANLILASVAREIKDMRSILLQLTLITQKAI